MGICLVSLLNLNECLVLEINKQNKKRYVASLSWSFSQSKNEFDQFLLNFKQLIFDRMSQNPHFVLVTGEFNVRSTSWWKDDLTTSEFNQVDANTSFYGFSQCIFKSTHILPNLPLYIDLEFLSIKIIWLWIAVFTTSLYLNCHEQLVYAELNLKIEYPSLYQLLVYDYKKTNTQLTNGTNVSSFFSLTRPFLIFSIISFQIRIQSVKTRSPVVLTTKSRHWLKRKIISLKGIWLMIDWSWIVSGCERQVQN